MSKMKLQIENGVEIGDAAAFALCDVDSNTVDIDAALMACMYTCIAQLYVRGCPKEVLIEELEDACAKGQELLDDQAAA